MREQRAQEIVAEALKHWRPAFGLALQLTGNEQQAEDLCQEAYLKLCQASRDLDVSRSLRGYLLTIVRNLAISRARRGAVAPGVTETDPAATRDPAARDPARESETRDEVLRVRRVLEDLAPAWRAVLYLRDGLGHSSEEVASILDKSEDTVRVTLHRARKKIRARLSGTETKR